MITGPGQGLRLRRVLLVTRAENAYGQSISVERALICLLTSWVGQRVFFDVTIGGSPAGRIVMELTDK
jgi:hypothetical protein